MERVFGLQSNQINIFLGNGVHGFTRSKKTTFRTLNRIGGDMDRIGPLGQARRCWVSLFYISLSFSLNYYLILYTNVGIWTGGKARIMITSYSHTHRWLVLYVTYDFPSINKKLSPTRVRDCPPVTNPQPPNNPLSHH